VVVFLASASLAFICVVVLLVSSFSSTFPVVRTLLKEKESIPPLPPPVAVSFSLSLFVFTI